MRHALQLLFISFILTWVTLSALSCEPHRERLLFLNSRKTNDLNYAAMPIFGKPSSGYITLHHNKLPHGTTIDAAVLSKDETDNSIVHHKWEQFPLENSANSSTLFFPVSSLIGDPKDTPPEKLYFTIRSTVLNLTEVVLDIELVPASISCYPAHFWMACPVSGLSPCVHEYFYDTESVANHFDISLRAHLGTTSLVTEIPAKRVSRSGSDDKEDTYAHIELCPMGGKSSECYHGTLHASGVGHWAAEIPHTTYHRWFIRVNATDESKLRLHMSSRRSDNDLPAGFAYGLIVVGVGLVSGFIIVARMYLKLRQRQDYDEI